MLNDSLISVSVIIPTYNSADSLDYTLEALEAQSYPREKYETIVVDDGSQDDTAQVVRKYNVRYLYQENRGPAAARNMGAKSAGGDIILFTDSDCVPDYHWIKEMISPFITPHITGVKGAYKTKQSSLWARFSQVEFNERYALLLESEYIDMLDTHSAGYRKEIFLKMDGFDTSFPVPNNEDTDLSYRMSSKGYKLVFTPLAFVWHLAHPDSMMKYVTKKFWRGYWRMVVYQKFSDKLLKDSYTPQTLKLQIVSLFLSLLFLLPGIFYSHVMLLYSSLFLGMFLALTVPFITQAMKHDAAIALLSPFFLLFRALAIGSGTLYWLVDLLRCRLAVRTGN